MTFLTQGYTRKSLLFMCEENPEKQVKTKIYFLGCGFSVQFSLLL